MEMTRLPDWPERLAAFLDARRGVVYRLGIHDCCMFAADAIRAMTGLDLASGFRGLYDDEGGAKRIIAEHGGLDELVDSFGLPRIDVSQARRGDVVRLGESSDLALGIMLDTKVVGVGLDGLVFRDRGLAKTAWRVA